MRKRTDKTTLHRDMDHRKALLKNLSTELVVHEQIITTVTKAKYLRPHVERLITKAKAGANFNNIKYMNKMLSTKEAVTKILTDVGPRFIKRPGGYTRIIKVGNKLGDNALMARIELVERSAPPKSTEGENKLSEKAKAKIKEIKKIGTKKAEVAKKTSNRASKKVAGK